MIRHLALCATALIDPTVKIVFLLRFLCFVAVVYLALHKIVARLSPKPGSKLLWFFSIVTAPLTRPIRNWLLPGASEDRIVSAALIFYSLLWLFFVLVARVWSSELV